METITVLFNWGGSRVLNKRSLSLEICFELEASEVALFNWLTAELETKICRESSG